MSLRADHAAQCKSGFTRFKLLAIYHDLRNSYAVYFKTSKFVDGSRSTETSIANNVIDLLQPASSSCVIALMNFVVATFMAHGNSDCKEMTCTKHEG